MELPTPAIPCFPSQDPVQNQQKDCLWHQLFLVLWSQGSLPQTYASPPSTLAIIPEAESSPSEPLRISKLISIWLSVSSSSGMVLIISVPSSSQYPDATFLALRLLPLGPECSGPPLEAATPFFKLRPFLAWPKPWPREAVPRLLGPSASCASTGSSMSLSSLKFTWDGHEREKGQGALSDKTLSDSRWRCGGANTEAVGKIEKLTYHIYCHTQSGTVTPGCGRRERRGV